jgi:hypothetical protein
MAENPENPKPTTDPNQLTLIIAVCPDLALDQDPQSLLRLTTKRQPASARSCSLCKEPERAFRRILHEGDQRTIQRTMNAAHRALIPLIVR